MDAISKIVTSLEVAIRYLLSGAVVSTLVAMSHTEYPLVLIFVAKEPLIATILVSIVGFIAFTLYRLIMWTVADFIAWKAGWSAPSLLDYEGCWYEKPYVYFLKWRYSGEISDQLHGYLTFRWSVAHFVCLSGISMILATLLSQHGSPIEKYCGLIFSGGLVILALGLWQVFFFFRVERSLCEDSRNSDQSA